MLDLPADRVTPLFVKDKSLECFESADGGLTRLMHGPAKGERIDTESKGSSREFL